MFLPFLLPQSAVQFSTCSRSSHVMYIYNDYTVGTDSLVCSLGITIISPGVNALRLHGWRHPLLSYLFLVLFFYSACQPFSWCWCGPLTQPPLTQPHPILPLKLLFLNETFPL